MTCKKRKIPWFWRRHATCIECHYPFRQEEKGVHNNFIECPRCKIRMSEEEFWDFNHEKWDRNADLSNE
jgi:peptide subunit release factor 1 (eRF1)